MKSFLTECNKVMLEEIYHTIYGSIDLPASWGKQDILHSVRKYFAGIDRALRMEP